MLDPWLYLKGFVFILQNQLSGNLLRKFKNSNGWQKLWVVFTNFSLFFYKSHQVRSVDRNTVVWQTALCLAVFHSKSLCRTSILWPAFLCWDTPLPFPPSQRTSTKTTSSSSISNHTSTISDPRASTPSRGTVLNPTQTSILMFRMERTTIPIYTV